MAEWKVFREKISLIPHPDPKVERLMIGKIGMYQVVVGKQYFQDGQTVVFVPDKSILPDSIADDGDRRKYLVGPEKNRVKAIKLQKELSCGIILDDKPEFSEYAFGQDIADKLGITKYEPELPSGLKGNVKPIGNIDTQGKYLTQHDCEQFNIYKDEINNGEDVIVTEKVHGSQLVFIRNTENQCFVSSKGLFGRQLTLESSNTNTYWQAINNSDLVNYLNTYYANTHIQIFGEVIPTQKGYNYGYDKPTLLIFRVELDGVNLEHDKVPLFLQNMWVPVLYKGPYNDSVRSLRTGNEQVSNKELHIREGCVISPIIPRIGKEGFYLYLKMINPDYKETGEEIS